MYPAAPVTMAFFPASRPTIVLDHFLYGITRGKRRGRSEKIVEIIDLFRQKTSIIICMLRQQAKDNDIVSPAITEQL